MEISEDLKHINKVFENIQKINKLIIKKKMDMVADKKHGVDWDYLQNKIELADLNKSFKTEIRSFKKLISIYKKKNYGKDLKDFYNKDLHIDCSELDDKHLYYNCPYCGKTHKHGSNQDFSNRTETRVSHCDIHRGMVYIYVNDFSMII